MPSANILRCRAGALAIATLALAAALAPPAALGAAGPARDGELSARLAALAKPSLRSAPRAEQARRLSLAADGAGSLLREGGRAVVDVRFDGDVVAGARGLRDAGAEVIHVSGRYRTVTAAVKPAGLHAVAAVPGVDSVTEVLAPLVSAVACPGLVTSEGDSQLGAASARSDFNVDGSGVTVGILSDSFDRDGGAPSHAGGDVATGDLPGPGNPCGRTAATAVLDDGDGSGGDEGRAMGQIVHDLAPGAGLAFASATALNSQLAFADNIRALRAAGADVLVDDILYFEEPFFQDGPVAVAVNEVAAAGAAYFSSAGNNNLIDGGRDIASWEAPEFRDAACPAELQAPPLEAGTCMDFDPAAGADPTFEISVAKDATLTLDLQWAQPWNGVSADLDAFLLDSEDKPLKVGELVVGSAEDNVEGSQVPVEVVQWENETGTSQKVRLAVSRCFAVCNPAADAGSMPRLKLALLQNGGGVTATEYEESAGGDVVGPTVFGHTGALSAIGVGAVPFSDGSTVEPYSSRGPVTHYFGPVVDSSPAGPIGPQAIPKPDLAATDGGANTFFGALISGVWRFFGTSASAPHAAAVAALMREANPSASLGQLRLALAATARPVGAFGPDAVGAGLVDASSAVSSIALPPTVGITERPPALGRNARPSIGFAANRPVSFACSVDGGAPQPCASPFVPPAPLSEGTHGFTVSATDVAGRSGQSEVVSFQIDTRRPRTFFRQRPPKTIRTRHRRAKAVFRFGSNERGVSFICRVDGGLPRFCRPRLVRRFRVGRHVLRVKAQDAAGNVDRTPAAFRFKVKRRG